MCWLWGDVGADYGWLGFLLIVVVVGKWKKFVKE